MLLAGIPDLASIAPLLKVILGFGAVIFVHELGHYLMAIRNGVFVEKFAIGFDFWGAKLARWERGGTEYVIGAFPLGGYVRMKGQTDLPSEADLESADPDSYQAKTIWQRTQIISAGVVMNFLSAFVLCYFALVFGYHGFPPEVGQVGFDELEAGLRPGDTITSLGDKPVKTWEEMLLIYVTAEPGSTLPIEVERRGAEHRLVIPVHRDPGMPLNYPGFTTGIELKVGALSAGLPADRAGVKPGDRLLAIDGVPIKTWGDFQQLVRRRADTDMELEVGRGDGQRPTLTVRPEARHSDRIPSSSQDLSQSIPPYSTLLNRRTGLAFGDAPWRSCPCDERPVQSRYGSGARRPGELRRSPQTLSCAAATRLTFTASPETQRMGHVLSSHTGYRFAGEPRERLVVGQLVGSGAGELRPGDVITSVSGVVRMPDGSAGDWSLEDPSFSVVLSVLKLTEERIRFGVLRDGAHHDFEVAVQKDPTPQMIGHVGVRPNQKEVLIKHDPAAAIVPALKAPFRILKDFVDGIRAMAMQRVSAKLISGPVGILQATYTYAEKSTGDLLNFLALLSVNLAIVNFLPIPITDGGHFVFLMYEKFKGRRMDDELMLRFQWAGLVFLVMVVRFATFNDVERLLGF